MKTSGQKWKAKNLLSGNTGHWEKWANKKHLVLIWWRIWLFQLLMQLQGCKEKNDELKQKMYMQNRNRLTGIENKLVVTKWEREEGKGKLEVWD